MSIASFSPANGAVGSSVTITGTAFNTTAANNIVYFGPTIGTVTAATATSLTVTVPGGASQGPLSVINTATNGRAESIKEFKLTYTGGNNTVSFNTQFVGITSSNYLQTATADFNNDGLPDIVSADQNNTKVSVFRNTTSTGASVISLATKLDLSCASGATNVSGIATADFDGDGKIDIVCSYVNNTTYRVTIYRNTTTNNATTLSFDAGVDIAMSTTQSWLHQPYLKIRDVNNDGKPDILYISTYILVNKINSPGTFTTSSFSDAGSAASGFGYGLFLSIGDVDADGNLDYATTTGYGGPLYIRRSQGLKGDLSSNNFSSVTQLNYSTQSNLYAMGDLDGDGKDDLVSFDYSTGGLSVFKSRVTAGSAIADSSFSGKLFIPLNTGTFGSINTLRGWKIELNDIDGDGKLDIVTTMGMFTPSNQQGYSTMVFRNTITSGTITSYNSFAPSSFASPYIFGIQNNSNDFTIGDLNNDGKPDIVLSNNGGLTILTNANNTPPTISSLDRYSGAVGSTVVITGTNFNTTATNNKVFFGATQATVTAATATSLTVTVPVGATFKPVSVTNSENTFTAYSLKPFMVTFTGGNNSVIFKSPVSFATTSSWIANGSVLGDLDGDGKADLAVLLHGGTLSIYKNTSTLGTLTSSVQCPVLLQASLTSRQKIRASCLIHFANNGLHILNDSAKS
jgi:hypothetical protein